MSNLYHRDIAVVTHNINKYKIATYILSIFLLISIFSNAILYRELTRYYKYLYSAVLDPLGLSYFQDSPNQIPINKPTAVFFGDSRAAQWLSPQTEVYSFTNRGIGNQSSAQVLLRFDEHIKPLHPEVIIIQVGINDLKTIPLFPERKHEIITNCKVNIEKIIEKAVELNATIILTTIFPASGEVPLTRRLVWSDDVYEAIDEVNIFIRSVQNDKVIIFDAASILSDKEGKTKTEYTFDLLHLNNDGYEALNRELVKILNP